LWNFVGAHVTLIIFIYDTCAVRTPWNPASPNVNPDSKAEHTTITFEYPPSFSSDSPNFLMLTEMGQNIYNFCLSTHNKLFQILCYFFLNGSVVLWISPWGTIDKSRPRQDQVKLSKYYFGIIITRILTL